MKMKVLGFFFFFKSLIFLSNLNLSFVIKNSSTPTYCNDTLSFHGSWHLLTSVNISKYCMQALKSISSSLLNMVDWSHAFIFSPWNVTKIPIWMKRNINPQWYRERNGYYVRARDVSRFIVLYRILKCSRYTLKIK